MSKIELREFSQSVVRNVVYVQPPEKAFADITSDKKAIVSAEKIMRRVTLNQPSEFHYTAAIAYPFETDHWMASRFSDGSFPAWYGSLDSQTAMMETAYHALNFVQNSEGHESFPVIERQRLVYDVQCQSLLVDLTRQPGLTAEDHELTQELGRKYYEQGLSGLLAPSIRRKKGVDVTIFRQSALQQAALNCHLTYRIMSQDNKVQVLHKKKVIEEIGF